MGFSEKSHQQIGCKQVTNGLLSGTFVAFQFTFVARRGCTQVLVTWDSTQQSCKQKLAWIQENPCIPVRCCQHLPSAEVSKNHVLGRSGFVRSSAVSHGACFGGVGWCLDCAVGPVCFLWAWGKVKGEAEADVGQGKGAVWVRLPHLAGGLREGTCSVQGTAGLGERLLAVCSNRSQAL